MEGKLTCSKRPGAIHRWHKRLRGQRYIGNGHQHPVGKLLDRHWHPICLRGKSSLRSPHCHHSPLTHFPHQAAGALPPHSTHTHFPELASWFVVLTVFTWSCAVAASARDVVLTACLTSLAIGSTIACCLFSYNGGTSETSGSGDGLTGSVTMGIKAASYFWMFAALCAWWRVTVYLIEEAYGPGSTITKFFPIGRTPQEKLAPYVIPGLGEPGVKRGVPKPM